MRLPLGVVADDLTGACDVGLQFRKRGLETVVLTDMGSLPDLKGEFDIVVVDTESRNLAPEDAYRKVRGTLKTLKEIGAELVYKKIDSTIRGNLGAELDAVMDESDLKAVIVAPAFPAHKRTTVSGHLLINNTPLERTEFAHNLLNPSSESHIPTLIGRQTERRVAHVNLFKVRSGVDSLELEIQKLTDEGAKIIVADAETKGDLANIARVSLDCGTLPCGSAGLAEEFSCLSTSNLRLLVVSGSVNTITLGQIAAAEKEPGVKVVEPDLSEVLTSEEKLNVAVKDLTSKVEEAFEEGRDVIIILAKSKDLISKVQEAGEKLGMSRLQVVDKLLSVLSEAFKKVIAGHRFASLILIGGDTSVRMMAALGAKGVRIENEVLPGIPAGRILGGRHEGMRVITKAGGFGDRYTLVKIIKSMKSI